MTPEVPGLEPENIDRQYLVPVNSAMDSFNGMATNLSLMPDVRSWLNTHEIGDLKLEPISMEEMGTFLYGLSGSLDVVTSAMMNTSHLANMLVKPEVMRHGMENGGHHYVLMLALDTANQPGVHYDWEMYAPVFEWRNALQISNGIEPIEPHASILAGPIGERVRRLWTFGASIGGLGLSQLEQAQQSTIQFGLTDTHAFADETVTALLQNLEEYSARQSRITSLTQSLNEGRPVSVEDHISRAAASIRTLQEVGDLLAESSHTMIPLVTHATEAELSMRMHMESKALMRQIIERQVIFGAQLVSRGAMLQYSAARFPLSVVATRAGQLFDATIVSLDRMTRKSLEDNPIHALSQWADSAHNIVDITPTE